MSATRPPRSRPRGSSEANSGCDFRIASKRRCASAVSEPAPREKPPAGRSSVPFGRDPSRRARSGWHAERAAEAQRFGWGVGQVRGRLVPIHVRQLGRMRTGPRQIGADEACDWWQPDTDPCSPIPAARARRTRSRRRSTGGFSGMCRNTPSSNEGSHSRRFKLPSASKASSPRQDAGCASHVNSRTCEPKDESRTMRRRCSVGEPWACRRPNRRWRPGAGLSVRTGAPDCKPGNRQSGRRDPGSSARHENTGKTGSFSRRRRNGCIAGSWRETRADRGARTPLPILGLSPDRVVPAHTANGKGRLQSAVADAICRDGGLRRSVQDAPRESAARAVGGA